MSIVTSAHWFHEILVMHTSELGSLPATLCPNLGIWNNSPVGGNNVNYVMYYLLERRSLAIDWISTPFSEGAREVLVDICC